MGGYSHPLASIYEVPKSWIEMVKDVHSIGVMKVCEYLIRHTFEGNGSYEGNLIDNLGLSLDEFVNGRKAVKKSKVYRVDEGIGLTEEGAEEALEEAVEHMFILQYDLPNGKSLYCLRMDEDYVDPRYQYLNGPQLEAYQKDEQRRQEYYSPSNPD